jgi:hypothetical protein
MRAAKLSWSVVALLAAGSCNAVQPKPLCKVQPADYAAKYVMTGSQGMCDDKLLTGELLHLQYYRTSYDSSAPASVGIEPDSIHAAVSEGEEAKVIVKADKEFSLGQYATVEPGDDNLCVASTMSETVVAVAEIPGDPAAMPPTETIAARDLRYKWSNLKMMVTPLSNAVYFGADLVRKDGDCIVNYKVSAVSPAKPCGDGVKEKTDEHGMPVKDAQGNVVTEPDPTTGKPDPKACEAVQGSGLNPYIDYLCDASPDGMHGSHLCVPKGDFPALNNKK